MTHRLKSGFRTFYKSLSVEVEPFLAGFFITPCSGADKTVGTAFSINKSYLCPAFVLLKL